MIWQGFNGICQWFPTFIVWRAIYFLWRALRATMLIFYIPSPLLPPFFSPHSPPVQQIGVLGQCCKLPQRGLGRIPSWQRILEHSRAKRDRFWHVPRDFAAFKATIEICRFLYQELVIFTITGIAAHTPLIPHWPTLSKWEFCSCCTCKFKIL